MSIPFWNTSNGRESVTPPERFNVPWLRTVGICSALLPPFLSLINLNSILPLSLLLPFTPRYLIYPHGYSLLTLLFAPFAPPVAAVTATPELGAIISHILQAILFWQLPSFVFPLSYAFWIPIGLLRTLFGYIFSRAVGWAYPWLFRHYALYETNSGFGPMIWAYCELTGFSDLSDLGPPANSSSGSNLRMSPRLRSYLSTGLGALLCWLDNTPWTYGVTALFIGAIRIITILLEPKLRRRQEVSTSKSSSIDQLRGLFYRTIISLLLISTPYYLLSTLTPSARMTTMPNAPFPPSPLLEILILSFPRPNSSLILSTTISSYLHYATKTNANFNSNGYNIRLSAFTGAIDHVAFKHLQTEFQDKDISFYVDMERHPEAVQGQHLHLAEAFRWVSEKRADHGHDHEQAEWVMLIEDDFPLCGGDVGWEAIVKVMNILESERPDERGSGNRKARVPKRRGAFVGTGGSGLIIHKTLLPTLIHILRTYAARQTSIAPGVFRRPADLIIQDCLLGVDPMCPPKTYEGDGAGLLITSRLVMDHIGGLSSTDTNKRPNSDKWRCGWRHPFHGLPEVQVVPVEGLW